MKVKTHARVTVTIEIPSTQVWNSNCDVEQIYKQAREEIIGVLRGAVVIDGLRGVPTPATISARIIGEPKVTAILVEDA